MNNLSMRGWKVAQVITSQELTKSKEKKEKEIITPKHIVFLERFDH